MPRGAIDDTSTPSLLRRLVAFDTTSRNSNLECIGFIREYLEARGARCTLIHDETGAKANLYATLGPDDRPGLALSGHTDVVPVDGQPWDTEPFEVVERNGLLYGRGTSDMKGFVAACLHQAERLRDARLEVPVHFCFSYDEEVGCLGVPRMLDHLKALPVRPAACIVGEPTSMRVVRAHKGKLSLRCTVRGLEAHSSLTHLGVNAVEAAAELIAYLRGMARRHRDEGPFDADFEPAYTTIHTGIVRGGTQLNIVPLECWFDCEFRYVPGVDPHALLAELKAFAARHILPEMHAVDPATGIDWLVKGDVPGLDEAEDADITRAARAVTGDNRSGKVAYCTEAGHFQNAGFPTIICGPGSIEQAHKPNEFVAVDQLAACDEFLERVLREWGRTNASNSLREWGRTNASNSN